MARNVKWGPKQSRLLYFMLKAPNQMLPYNSPQPVEPYAAIDKLGRQQVSSLHALVDQITIQKPRGLVDFMPFEGRLRGALIERIYDIMRHYKALLLMTTNLPEAEALKAALQGKDFAQIVEEWRAPEDEEDDEALDEDEDDPLDAEPKDATRKREVPPSKEDA